MGGPRGGPKISTSNLSQPESGRLRWWFKFPPPYIIGWEAGENRKPQIISTNLSLSDSDRLRWCL